MDTSKLLSNYQNVIINKSVYKNLRNLEIAQLLTGVAFIQSCIFYLIVIASPYLSSGSKIFDCLIYVIPIFITMLGIFAYKKENLKLLKIFNLAFVGWTIGFLVLTVFYLIYLFGSYEETVVIPDQPEEPEEPPKNGGADPKPQIQKDITNTAIISAASIVVLACINIFNCYVNYKVVTNYEEIKSIKLEDNNNNNEQDKKNSINDDQNSKNNKSSEISNNNDQQLEQIDIENQQDQQKPTLFQLNAENSYERGINEKLEKRLYKQ